MTTMKYAIDIRNDFLSTDIICVRFHGSFVLAGIGGTLKIFSLFPPTCLSEVEIFQGHKIYGIQSGADNKILIFGAKAVRVFTFSYCNEKVCLSNDATLELQDWILAAHWLSNGSEIALVTAHNVVWLWQWHSKEESNLKRAICTEKCILYSATVCGEDWESSVAFAGTVFKEVVVWLPGKGEEDDQPVIHRLEGHNGVIFSLVWDEQSSSLCSTSDDRSIRLWKFSFPTKYDWKSSIIVASQVFYGHSARVWRSIIYKDFIISVGEDCQICMWSRKGKLLQIFERAASGCQWCLDCSEEHQLLVTGAGDGSIQLLPLSLLQNIPSAVCVSYPETIHEQICSRSIRKLILLKAGLTVAVTEDGRILSGHPSTEGSWQILSQDKRFENYCVLSVSPDRAKFSLASLKGLLAVFQSESLDGIKCIIEKDVEVGKIWSLLWLSSEELLVCGDEGRLSVWKICQNSGNKLICIGRFRLPKARERWPTCARILTRDCIRFILCGDRCGSIHLFTLPVQEHLSPDQEYLGPDHSLIKVHGKLGVTSMLVMESKIFSTGRDGTVRNLGIDLNSRKLSVLSTNKMIMDWVCAVLPVAPSSKDFLVIGFKETNFILWSAQERRTLLQLDCGGGHRSWDCIVSYDKSIIQFAFVREKNIFHLSRSLEDLMKPTLLLGISSRELNCVAVLHDISATLLFGGEDGTIHLCKFSDNISDLESKQFLTSHISSVRCLSLCSNLLFSAGGRAQLKAWKIERDNDEEISCVELASFMLKGERHARAPPSVDPEMRFMTLCSLPSPKDKTVVQLVSGCSDGALRWLNFDSVNKDFQLVSESMFHQKCVLKLLAVPLQADQVILISTATDGVVALWDISSAMPDAGREPFWSSRFHQSGVNSVHVKIIPDEKGFLLLMGSGGDDNSVVLSAVQLLNRDVSIVSKWSSSSAHAAQVTGVWLVGEWLLSTSIDQRLTVWHWKWSSTSQLECNFVHQTICCVPDIQDMQVWQEKGIFHICVVGKGVQIFSIQIPDNL